MYYVKENLGGSSDFYLGEILNSIHENPEGVDVVYADGDEFHLHYGQILDNSYSSLIKNQEADIAEIRPLSKLFSDEDVQSMMYYHRLENNMFIQNGHLPTQTEGWKLHISANSFADYCSKLQVLIPELIQANICFKVLKPSKWNSQSGTQRGKLITVYLTEIPSLSESALYCLFSGTSIPVEGEKQIGSSYFRYGAYTGKTIWNPIQRCFVPDERGKYKPDYVDDLDWITLFYANKREQGN